MAADVMPQWNQMTTRHSRGGLAISSATSQVSQRMMSEAERRVAGGDGRCYRKKEGERERAQRS